MEPHSGTAEPKGGRGCEFDDLLPKDHSLQLRYLAEFSTGFLCEPTCIFPLQPLPLLFSMFHLLQKFYCPELFNSLSQFLSLTPQNPSPLGFTILEVVQMQEGAC